MTAGCGGTAAGSPSPFLYLDPPAIAGRKIPAPAGTEDLARGFAGLQFGPGEKEVAYLVLDYCDRRVRYERVSVYVPDHGQFGAPRAMEAKTRDENRVAFRPFAVSTAFGEVSAALRIRLGGDQRALRVTVDCELRGGEGPAARFVLVGRMKPGFDADLAIEPVRLLQPPAIRLTLDHRGNPPNLYGAIRMGRFRLLPGSGMDSKVTLLVKTGDGRTKVRRNLAPEPERDGCFRYAPHRRLLKDFRYTGTALIDLGPLLGRVSASTPLTPRK